MKDLPSAVGFAAKLKPEIRLAQAISEFHASLNNKNQRARFKNLQSQSPPSPDDTIRLTEEINTDGARAHRSWRPYGTRLVAILERMRQFAPIGDVLVGGSQNLIACGVWAVVRLSLEASLSFLSYFENVTNMMLRLGRSLSLHKDFAMLFPRCPTLQSYMCEYTIVMVNICAKIVHNCAKSTLSQLAASLTSTFDAVFKPLESDLATWAHLIEKRATILLAKADLQSQSLVLNRFNRLQVSISQESATRQRKARKHTLLTSLFPDQAEFDLIWRRERRRGTSTWLYKQDAYKSWLSSPTWSLLWLRGNLGSGKTVVMASAAAHLISAAAIMEPQGAVTVSYFFCQSKNHKTLCATALLGSIVGQTLQNPSLNPSLMSFLERKEITPNSCARLEDYVGILLSSTPSNWRGIFVLDGLDEMPEEEVDDICCELKRLREHRRVHILCSSRPTSACYTIARSNLDEMWTLSMETADRSDDIRTYITAEISRWNRIRPLPTTLERLVEEQLLAGCQGMFLWLSLQIEDICPRYTQELRSDAEILDIIGNLPKDLPEAFDKALSRMRNEKYGNKLFKLVASAEPPLTMDELRVAFNVEPGNTRWDNSKLYSSGKALISAHGGSLLDIDEEDLRVRFIHYSVLLHLTAPSSDARTGAFHFDLREAKGILGAVCTTYLNYSVFENRISTAQRISFRQVPQAAVESVMPSEVSRKAFSLLSKNRRQNDAQVDLERLSYELRNERWRVRDDVHLLLNYAQNQWLSSTQNIWSDDRHDLLMLWRNLIASPIVSSSLPWETVPEAVAWALRNGHATLFQHYLHSSNRHHLEDALSAAAAAVSTGAPICLRGEELGWLAPLYLLYPHYQGSTLRKFTYLGCKPFQPSLAKCPSPNLTGAALTKSAASHIVAALKEYRKDRDTDGHILFLASCLDDPNLILDDHSTILHLAIDHGCLSLASELLSKGANPDGGRSMEHPSALQVCLRKKYTSLAHRLIESGADITTNLDDQLPPLFLAIDDSNWGLFNAFLLRGGFSKDGRYGPKLETACHRLCAREVDVKTFSTSALLALVDRGANINSRNAGGETPLLLAVRTRKPGLTGVLLGHGANPNIGDCDGVRPLHYAQDTETIQDLLRREANPDSTTVHSHITPLMVAAHHGHAHVVDALLNGGADPFLCLSADLSSTEALLLDWRGQPGVKPAAGTTALHLCSWRLARELEVLKGSSRHYHGFFRSEIAQLCSELVSIIKELLKRGVGSDSRYSTLLAWLSDLLSKGGEKNPTLRADLNRALDFIPAIGSAVNSQPGRPPER